MVRINMKRHQIPLENSRPLLITQKQCRMGTLRNVIFLLLCLQLCTVYGQIPTHKKIIVIDPGHGGVDPGAIGINGIQEKEVTLKVAQEMVRLSKTLFDNQIDIHLTRYRDTLISLSDRIRLAKALKAELFVSLHCNHATNLSAKGIEVYAYKKKNAHSTQAIWLAHKLQKELKNQLGFQSRGVKFANFQVLRETAQTCPEVLIELGFLSNKVESEYLLQDHNIQALALAILLGLEDGSLPKRSN